MNTEITTSPSEAAEYVRRGRLVAFPTETVYGLGADAFRPESVRRIFEVKERPVDNPLIVHVGDREQIYEVAAAVPPVAERLLEAFVPGPLTLILPKHDDLPTVVTAGLDTVGVRIPELSITQDFLEACDTPVPAPSANRSGRPSPTTWEAVQTDLGGRIECILQGGRTDTGVESTVVDCTTTPVTVLRPGAVSVEDLQTVVSPVTIGTESAGRIRSPGTRHRHYAPAARVCPVQHPSEAEGGSNTAYIGIDEPPEPQEFGMTHVEKSTSSYAHDLFHVFRECDRRGYDVIYAQTVDPEGLGRALNDRLRRAANR